MRRVLIGTILAVLLSSLLISLAGCSFEQQGETVAEGHRRHIRNLRLSRQQMMEDLDMALMTEKAPSLTSRSIPR